MPEQEETYRGFEIVIDESQGTPSTIKIADTTVEVSRMENGKYITQYMPYTEYDSLMELARHVIDKVPDFETS